MTAEIIAFPAPVAWEPYITEKMLAAYLGCSERTIRRYRSEGMPSRKLGGHRRYRLSEAVQWFAEREEGSA